VILDISHPHDLRMVLNKPAVTTAEVDAMVADPNMDDSLKAQLLDDVEPQGYQRPA
jgi:hypothetical protein